MSEENRLESSDAAANETEAEEELTTPILGTEPESRPDAWPEEPAPPARAVLKAPKPVTRAQVFWTSFALGLLFFVLAVAVSLGILVAYNGGLWYASPNQVVTISRQVDGLTAQLDAQAQDLAGLRARLDELQDLDERVDTEEAAADQLQTDADRASWRVCGTCWTAWDMSPAVAGRPLARLLVRMPVG